MDKEQQKQWAEAQQIPVSVNLAEAAKNQLKFLAVVDRNRYLYEDCALQWAVYRYNAFWLPLLAKHTESALSEGPLVVPLDCEWIWHCHRLNPVRYKLDCQKLYGRILTNCNVISSVQAMSKSKTVEIWKKMYPEEPYELDLSRSFDEDVLLKRSPSEKFTSYDLISAVKRQISFTYQVSRPHMSDELFLREAEARYKGFLHLTRTNRKLGIKRFCVPTYDIDLMWHTHQLHPYYYCNDLIRILGTVLEHDDTDSDRSKGGKLNTGFYETTRQFEETFGKRYWMAGAMYRGNAPTPVTQLPSRFRYEGKEISPMRIFDTLMPTSTRKVVEVCLEFVEIKNLPSAYKDNLRVSFSKNHSDKFFNTKRSLTILPKSGEKQVAYFQCEPTGEFRFELQSHSSEVLSCCSLSWEELLDSPSQLSADKWLSVEPVSSLAVPEPILLRVSASSTPPTPAPQVFHLKQSQVSSPFCKKFKDASSTTYVTDDDENLLFDLQMGNIGKGETKYSPELLKEVHYITDSGEKQQVAEFLGRNWVIRGMHGFFVLQSNDETDDHLFELVGNKMVKLFSGRRLEFEPKQYGNRRCEQDFVTAVEFSADDPYGKAMALFDLQLGTVKALDEWIVLPGITLAFLLSDVLSKKKCSGFDEQYDSSEEVVKSGGCGGGKCASGKCGGGSESMVKSTVYGGVGSEDNVNGGSCGGGKCAGTQCGTGSETRVKSAYCGGECGGNCAGTLCETRVKNAYCGGECGGNCAGTLCETQVKSAYCGGECSGNCAGTLCETRVKSAYCGGECSGNCAGTLCGTDSETRVKSTFCGSECVGNRAGILMAG